VPENLRKLRRKRHVVGEIRQITRAMKLVSAAKLKRTTKARETVDYYFSQFSGAISVATVGAGSDFRHPLMRTRPLERVGLLVVAGDKGLCGGFNAGIVSRARSFVESQEVPVDVMTMGARTSEMCWRAQLRVTREFPAMLDRLQGQDAAAIADYALGLFRRGEVDSLHVCHARFISRTATEPAIECLLPIAPSKAADGDPDDHLFEPVPGRLLADLLPAYVRAQVYQMLLETAVSEHSARLLAMSTATESAEEILEDLTRLINRSRQAQITRELLDVVGGADALEHQA